MAKNIFEKVLENVDIVEVVREFVDLQPQGKNLFGLCPFHDDHNPSMSVTHEYGGRFNCWQCHTAGNAIKFIELYKHMSPIEAALFLADKYNIDVSEFRRVSEKTENLSRYYKTMDYAQKFYSLLMNDANFSKEAREYLKERNINDDAIEEFGIGLAPNDPVALTKNLEKKGVVLSDLMITGLALETHDEFMNRIMVPIRDEQGRPIAFGGRIYRKEDSDQAKYMNSKETPIFKKGYTVFNLSGAAKYVKNLGYLIINEGYMDVIQEYSQGIKNAVAIMGTALTDEQAELIKKYTSNVVICLDGDMAGLNGALAITKHLEAQGINYSMVALPDNLDPDEYLRKYGVESYKKYLKENRVDKMTFAYNLAKRKYGSLSSFNMDSFKREIFLILKNENSRTSQETGLKTLSKDMNVSYDSLEQDFAAYLQEAGIKFERNSKNKPVQDIKFQVSSAYFKAEKMIVDYAITGFEYFKEITAYMESRAFLRDKNLRKLFISIGDIYDSDNKINVDNLILMLKGRGVYENHEYDEKCQYSMDDLKGNVLPTFKIQELKENIEEIKVRLRSEGLSPEEKSELVKLHQEKTRELKEKINDRKTKKSRR